MALRFRRAKIAVHSYWVMIHGVNTGSLPSRDEALNEDQAVRWIKQRDDVYHQPDGLEASRPRWLYVAVSQKGQKAASLILQLPTP